MKNWSAIAEDLDAADTLAPFRQQFLFPTHVDGSECLYFAGNSLGLQPKQVRPYILQELDDWAALGVEGHLHAKNAWLPYHELLTPATARLVGALESEVVIMNSLTVNLHLMMASFYRPDSVRRKILIEGGAFPSDQYAVKSQIAFHGYDPKEDLVELWPREGEEALRPDDILKTIESVGQELALILIGNVNYRTGQCFDMRAITKAGHRQGAKVGFDLAHGAGNLVLQLHDDGPDFAAWCSYKYLNAGPGAIAGVFVHDRHREDPALLRLSGWWGHDKTERFQMKPDFKAIPGAEGWQLSNPPIFQLAALRASLEIFDRATMPALRRKADGLTQFFEGLMREVPEAELITPTDLGQRGTQLSYRFKGHSRQLVQDLAARGAICDFREPDVIRVAPVPLYTRYGDLVRLNKVIRACL